MRKLIRLLIVLSVLGGLGYAGYIQSAAWLKNRRKTVFRTTPVEFGDMRITRNASGEIKPVLSVLVGSFVSGPVTELFVDFNDEVKVGQPLAKIDPRIYEAALLRDQANLLTQKASVERVRAELQRAKNDEQRSLMLKAENVDFISQTELDQFRFSRMALEAQLTVSEASIKVAEATLMNSQANIEYTNINSPVDGIVIDRKIDPGQTLAASFQTPELFVIAPQMREKMHIFASVDEADIGLIREARDSKQPVTFTVEAYPGEVFREGLIEQIRLSSTTTQNVVTYPVVVSTPNVDMKLLPGMTATLTFQIRELKDIVKIPSQALNFLPDKKNVRDADLGRLDLDLSKSSNENDEAISTVTDEQPVDELATDISNSSRQVVWVVEGEKLRAVDVRIGEENNRSAQMLEGDLKAGDELVIGVKAANTGP
jgi:HlyD family secretion protein